MADNFSRDHIDDALPYPKKALVGSALIAAVADKTGTPTLLEMHSPFETAHEALGVQLFVGMKEGLHKFKLLDIAEGSTLPLPP